MSFLSSPFQMPGPEPFVFPWDLEEVRRSLYYGNYCSNFEQDEIEILEREFKKLRFHLRENYFGFLATFRHFGRFLKKV